MKGKKTKPMPKKFENRSSGFELPDYPDRKRAAQDRASDEHIDPQQSSRAKRFKAKSQLKALQS